MKGIIPVENGWMILVDKPEGITSNRVLSRVKGITKIRKAGHGGSLDPMATGLVVVALAKATKLLSEKLAGSKKYQAVIQLGCASPTWDRDANTLVEYKPPQFSAELVMRNVKQVMETSSQVPPMVSALKRGGRALYQLYHKGYWLKRDERPMQLESIQLLSYDEASGRLQVEIEGGGGIYIRSIANDIGKFLGVPAILIELRRLQVGEFTIEQACTLEELENNWLPAA